MLQILIIGQAPRLDLEAELCATVPGLRYRMDGALDGLTRAAIAGLAPRDDADTLFTILPSGESVTISKAAVTRRMLAKITEVHGPTLLACTGRFKGLPERTDLVQPSAVLNALAEALLPRGRLGLFVPLPEQVASLAAERARGGLDVFAVALRPQGDDAARAAAARLMADHAPDLVLLDCISYTRRDKAVVAASLHCPVLLSVAVAARAAACLLNED